MKVRLTKKTSAHHLFEIERADGTSEQAMLETRSFMPHDLIHFAYESLAGCKHSFYGRLAAGTALSAFRETDILSETTNKQDVELATTERITGPLTALLHKSATDHECIQALRQLFELRNETMPPHITIEFLERLKERFRQLWGQWSALPHHKVMEMNWTTY